MYTADMLQEKLEEVKELILQRINPDGTCQFDTRSVFVALELATRLITEGIKDAGNLDEND